VAIKGTITEVQDGYLVIDRGSGPPVRYDMTTTLLESGASAIGTGITSSQVTGVKYLANLIAVILRVLKAKDIIDDDFSDGELAFSLDDIEYILGELGGSYVDPDFNEVEDA